MSEFQFQEVERAEIAVQFVRVPDGLPHIRRAWDELEAVVALRGRHFYGAFDPVADDYRACVVFCFPPPARRAVWGGGGGGKGPSWRASSPGRSLGAATSAPGCAAS